MESEEQFELDGRPLKISYSDDKDSNKKNNEGKSENSLEKEEGKAGNENNKRENQIDEKAKVDNKLVKQDTTQLANLNALKVNPNLNIKPLPYPQPFSYVPPAMMNPYNLNLYYNNI